MSPAQSTPEAAEMVRKIQAGAIPHGLSISGMPEGTALRDHQKASVAFMVLTPKCLLFDEMGLGKSLSGAGFLQYLADRGKLGTYPQPRAIIVTTAPNVRSSWQIDAFERFLPGMKIAVARGTKNQRLEVYNDPTWQVLVTNYETVRGDVDWITQLDFGIAILDECDVLKNPSALVTKATKRLVANCERRIGMTGTPFTDKTLTGFWSLLDVLGITEDFAANKTAFENYYHTFEYKEVWAKVYDKQRRIKIPKKRIVKELQALRNVVEFKEKLRPYYLRRKRQDVNIKMPELRSIVKYIDPTPEQERLYKQAKSGFLKIGSAGPQEIERQWDYLRAICVNTALVGGKDSSAKMDWFVDELQTGWKKDKVVLFINRLQSVELQCERLEKAGIGYVKIIGATTEKKRLEAIERFRNDPDCQVLVGTRTLVRGLNLQIARIQVNYDLLFNPGEVEQVAGRVARDGSLHDECLVVTLFIVGTIEHALWKHVNNKQGVSDFVLDDKSSVFQQLTPQEQNKLIKS